VAPFDVILAKVRLGKAAYARWCIVLEVRPDGGALVLPCSTKFQYCHAGIDFEIHDYLEGFKDTGLDESSYVIETDIQGVSPANVKKVKGRLTGDLARRFADWAGVPPPQ
jgi:hypothetical protein